MPKNTANTAKSTKSTVKRGRPPVLRQTVLLALQGSTVKTRHELGISASYAAHLVAEGLIVKGTDTVPNVDENGKALRGRPAHTYKLTKAGRDKARSLARKAAQAAPVVESTSEPVEAVEAAVEAPVASEPVIEVEDFENDETAFEDALLAEAAL